MWRYLVGGGAALVLALAGMFVFRGSAAPEPKHMAAPPAVAAAEAAPLPDQAPSADERTREQKRFDRIDKDRNETITREEFFALRHKLFAKMDANRDGKLSFDEWAVRGVNRFAGADKDKSATLDRTEFATTAMKRRATPRCACPQGASTAAKARPAAAEDDEDSGE